MQTGVGKKRDSAYARPAGSVYQSQVAGSGHASEICYMTDAIK